MCGIAGVLSTSGLDPARQSVERMLTAARHRGPDATRQHTVSLPHGHLVLGHTRLAIIDLSHDSDQPMIDPETGSCLVFNGEIYNFHELKAELEAKGCRFRSRGDTEVLLKALLCWGTAALTKLHGMYAFAFWDALQQRLILARDPLGIKPLYYAHKAGSLVFGSEIKIIQASNPSELTLNQAAIRTFLVYGAVIRPTTMFEQVVELAPGSFVAADSSARMFPQKRFWSVAAHLEPSGTLDQPADSVNQAMQNAVKRHVIADVETAVALSGGIDSALIAALAVQAKANIRLLTLAFPEKEHSEEASASLTARHVGARHDVVTVTSEDLLEQVPLATASMDQPTVDGINTMLVSKAAASLGIKVLLSGLGGDEIFGGYSTFVKLPLMRSYPTALKQAALLRRRLSLSPQPQFNKLEHLNGNQALKEMYLLQRSIRWHGASGAVETDACPPVSYALPAEMWGDLQSSNGSDSFHEVAGLEMQFYMANQLLRDADVFSMASSIEMRVPLLDLDLVTASMRQPGHRHVRPNSRKRLGRRLLSLACPNLRLPKAKRGFTLPWTDWLRGALRKNVEETLHDQSCHRAVGLESASCERAARDFFLRDPLVPWQQVWSLFVLFQWLDRNRGVA